MYDTYEFSVMASISCSGTKPDQCMQLPHRIESMDDTASCRCLSWASMASIMTIHIVCSLAFGVMLHFRFVASESPVFGILSQPVKNSNETMIAASYVKWLEAGGARSIPIPYDATEELVDEIFCQIDGVVFPGGGSDLPAAAVYLWSKIRNAHSVGDAIPIWGTCLGFEFLLQLATQNTSILETGYKAENISLPLEEVVSHRLYRSRKLFRDVQTRNITMNNHEMGLSPERFASTPELRQLWKVTSINHDLEGRPFVSTIEPIDELAFPVYGVQFHPEKNSFEYATYPHSDIPYEAIDHSKEGIAMSLFMASFVVDLARRNPTFGKSHSYDDPDRFPLVYSYDMELGLKFEQVFRIPPASHWKERMTEIQGTTIL
jgi:gamma-glutamyl hydrolase